MDSILTNLDIIFIIYDIGIIYDIIYTNEYHNIYNVGIIGLARLFKIMDDDGSNTLSFLEFKKAMKECAMNLTEAEIIILFKRFDMKNNGVIAYDDFLRVITGSLNKRRKKIVNMAFDVLDRDGSGYMTMIYSIIYI